MYKIKMEITSSIVIFKSGFKILHSTQWYSFYREICNIPHFYCKDWGHFRFRKGNDVSIYLDQFTW